MMEETKGLKRRLREGESVILSTGATATARRSYPAGYTGDVEILLDGREELERASGLIISDDALITSEASEPDGNVRRTPSAAKSARRAERWKTN